MTDAQFFSLVILITGWGFINLYFTGKWGALIVKEIRNQKETK